MQQIIEHLLQLNGALASAIVDSETNSLLAKGSNDDNFDLDVIATRDSEVIRAKMRIMARLEMDDEIHDILITLPEQYHMMCPSKKRKNLFIYLAVNKQQANLSSCRKALFQAEKMIM